MAPPASWGKQAPAAAQQAFGQQATCIRPLPVMQYPQPHTSAHSPALSPKSVNPPPPAGIGLPTMMASGSIPRGGSTSTTQMPSTPCVAGCSSMTPSTLMGTRGTEPSQSCCSTWWVAGGPGCHAWVRPGACKHVHSCVLLHLMAAMVCGVGGWQQVARCMHACRHACRHCRGAASHSGRSTAAGPCAGW